MEFALYIFWYLNTFRLQKRTYQNCVMRYEQCCHFLEQGGGWGPSIYAFLQTSACLVKFMFYAYFCGTFFLFLLLPPYCFYCNDQSPERLVTTVTNMSYISFLFNIAVWECKVTGVKATSECLQKEPHRTTFYSVTVHYWHCSVRIDWGVLLFQFFARLCPLLHCISCSIMCSNKHTVKTAFVCCSLWHVCSGFVCVCVCVHAPCACVFVREISEHFWLPPPPPPPTFRSASKLSKEVDVRDTLLYVTGPKPEKTFHADVQQKDS